MADKKILVINCGSSSLKYQLFEMPAGKMLVKGLVEKIGLPDSAIKQETADGRKWKTEFPMNDHTAAFNKVVEGILDKEHGVLNSIDEIDGVGHRVVHGGEKYSDSVKIDDKVIADIQECADLAPLHNPANLQGIVAAMKLFKNAVHTATFDTAFHATMPDYAYMYALPYEYYEQYKIRRYGFHGTSHRYVTAKCFEVTKSTPADTNIITVHIGNGGSVTAVRGGKSVDTSMGLTPLEGVIMGTRSGDLDPAIIHYLVSKGMTESEVNSVLNKKSGMLGLSGVSSDLRDVEAAAKDGNKRAQLALDAFAYRVKKYIGSYSAALGKVNYVVFTGGIGENSAVMRERICKNLENIGIKFDATKNNAVKGIGYITTEDSPVKAIVIPTDEEQQMARDTYSILTK